MPTAGRECWAACAVTQDDLKGAARILGAASAPRQDIGEPVAPYYAAAYARILHDVQAGLDELTLSNEWAAGAVMSLEEALANVLALPYSFM